MAGPTIDQAFITKFNRDVHLVYQQKKSKIRGTVRTDADVDGNKVRFQKIGTVTAQSKGRHGDIPPSNPDHSYVEATMNDRYTLDYIDKLDLTKLNIDLRGGYVETHARAFGRETDDQIITAMTAGATLTQGTYSGNLTRNFVLEACEQLDAGDVDDDGMRFGLITPRSWSHLMTVSEFVSGDYVGPDLPFTKIGLEMRTWNGVHWIKHTRLPGRGTSQAKNYLYHFASVGHGINDEVDITWDWENKKKAWSGAGSMSMGAVVIDSAGLVELRVDDTAALP